MIDSLVSFVQVLDTWLLDLCFLLNTTEVNSICGAHSIEKLLQHKIAFTANVFKWRHIKIPLEVSEKICFLLV